jgi:hypothetical protein
LLHSEHGQGETEYIRDPEAEEDRTL